MRRRRWIALAVGLLVAAGGAWAFEGWRLRGELERARREVASGLWLSARPRLAMLAGRWPRDGEVLYHLGIAEMASGRPDRADEAWAKVPTGSAFAGRAALMRAREALKHHRLADAEEAIPPALDEPGEGGLEAFETLLQLYKIEGRLDEARRLVIRGWGRRDRAGMLQELLRLDRPDPIAVEKLAPILETAARGAPDDDRIWLGQAALATRNGRLDEARKRLDDCLRRRPDDPAVWRARLVLARADDDEAEVRRALAHLPDDRVSPAEVLSLRAWLAGRAGDDEAERRALEDLVARDPRALPAMERLAELLLRAGRPDRAKEVRALQAERARALDWYVDHIFPDDRLDHAPGLARAAETLGRPFEARAWWELAAERPSTSTEARTEIARLDRDRERTADAPTPPALTPSGLLAELGTRPAPGARAEVARPGGAPPRFSDDAEAAGLRFTFDNGFEPQRQLPETMSGGVGLLDFDGDGRLDVYLVQGGTFPPRPGAPNSGDRLFRNKGDGTFEDATERSGIARMPRGYGHGVAVGDVDNDGHPDLFLTRWRSYALFRNKGDGTFEDATARFGLGGDRDWPTSAAFADLDGDGDLDLYVCHYVKWDSDHPATCWKPERNAYGYCQLHEFPSMPDHLFRNDGGKFVDVTAEAGIVDRAGRGLGVVATDVDGDGRVDLFVTNDESAKFLFLNRGGLKFEEVALAAGVASSASGAYQASMGVAAGDVDSDGRPDLVVTNFYNEYTALYLNLGDGLFADRTAAFGLDVPSRYRLGFGVALLDVNDDGRPDLATVNGHVDDNRPDVPWRMPSQLFVGSESEHRFVDVTDRAGPAWQVPLAARGLAAGDLDNDGRVDLVAVSQNQPVVYFHNRTEGGRSLTLRLEGGPSNRDAVGARVTVTAGGTRRVAWRSGGGSYQSASDPRLHFGLGPLDTADEVEVAWPSGRVDRHRNLKARAGYHLREGHPDPTPLPGFDR